MSLNLLVALRNVAARMPGRPAIVEESGAQISIAALVERITRIKAGFAHAGMQRGQRVLFAIRPSIEAIATLVAIADLGAVIVAAPIGGGDRLFSTQMQLVQPRWVVAESVLIAAMRSWLMRKLIAMRGGLLPSSHSLSGARFIAAGRWLPGLDRSLRLRVIENNATPAESTSANLTRDAGNLHNVEGAHLDDRDELFIVFTSGTTAAPKAVVHSRGSLARTLEVVGEQLSIGEGDRLFARDLHLVLPALLAGATAYMPGSGAYNPARTLGWLSVSRCTHVFDVTANLQKLADYLASTGRTFPTSIKQMMIGAAPVRKSFFERLETLLPADAQAWCVYGMTEMLPVATIELKDKLAYNGPGDIVGSPVHGVTVSISESGELVVQGAHMFAGYLGQPASRSHATGDLARLDDGRIVLVGRVKDMIIRREYNIYPELHESIVERIDGVRRCAMIGIMDDSTEDERVVLVVEPTNVLVSQPERDRFAARVAQELRNGVNRIDEAALPDEIVVGIVPQSGRSHKVDKAALRQTYADRSGRSSR